MCICRSLLCFIRSLLWFAPISPLVCSDLSSGFSDLLLSDVISSDLLFADLSNGWLDRIVDRRCRFKFAAHYGTTCHDGRDITATSIHARTSRPILRIFCAKKLLHYSRSHDHTQRLARCTGSHYRPGGTINGPGGMGCGAPRSHLLLPRLD